MFQIPFHRKNLMVVRFDNNEKGIVCSDQSYICETDTILCLGLTKDFVWYGYVAGTLNFYRFLNIYK